MSNRLRAAVDDYLEEEREYIREAEAEINRLSWEVKATRLRTQRAMIAAMYFRAGIAEEAQWDCQGDSMAVGSCRTYAHALKVAAVRMERLMNAGAV